MNLLEVYVLNPLSNILTSLMKIQYSTSMTPMTKKIDLYPNQNDLELVFNREFYPQTKPEIQYNTTIFLLKRSLLQRIEHFSEGGHTFSHIFEFKITN